MRLYIIRHATPDYKNDCLTAGGCSEAAALARRLAAEGLTDLYSSPLGRSVETMKYTEELTGLTGTIEPWAEELSNVRISDPHLPFQPHVSEVSGEAVRTEGRRPVLEDWHTQPPFDDPDILTHVRRIQDGSDEFLARHGYAREDGLYRIVERNRRRLAVFCHNGSALAWLAHLLALPVSLLWAGFYLHPSSITTVLLEERSPDFAVPRCLALGEIGHLHQAGLVPRPVGLKANYD
jgi:broad specificity phosphatase PhoE